MNWLDDPLNYRDFQAVQARAERAEAELSGLVSTVKQVEHRLRGVTRHWATMSDVPGVKQAWVLASEADKLADTLAAALKAQEPAQISGTNR